MTGAEHYAEAERLLRLAMLDDDQVEAGREGELAAAQVHATLAQVAYLREIGDQLDTFPRVGTITNEFHYPQPEPASAHPGVTGA